MKKFDFTNETKVYEGITLHRIVALRSFGDVKKGDKGGWLQYKKNLSHNGKCWVYDESIVSDDAQVRENAKIRGRSEILWNASVFGNAIIECSRVNGFSIVSGNTYVSNSFIENASYVHGNASIYDSRIFHNGEVFGNALISGDSTICCNAKIFGNAIIQLDSHINDHVSVSGKVVISNLNLAGNAKIESSTDFIAFSLPWLKDTVVWTKSNDLFYYSNRLYSRNDFYNAKPCQYHGRRFFEEVLRVTERI